MVDMTQVTVQMDDAELAEAQRMFGTKTPDETLREGVRRAMKAQLRQEALEEEFSPERAEQYATLRDLPR
jgi:Arc/MetJ family transcription regulator